MKISFIRVCILTILTLSVALSSCEQKKEHQANIITFDTIRVAKTYHLDGDSTKPSCSIKLTYVYPTELSNEETLAKMHQELNFAIFEDNIYENLEPQKAVDEYVINYINTYKQEEISNFGKWQNSLEPEEYYSFYKIIDSRVLFNEANIVSYQIKSTDQKAALKAANTYQNLVFDLTSGKAVNEEDIFVEEYRKPLSDILKNKLLTLYKLESIDQLLEMGYFDVEDMSPNNNFWVNGDGITYLYNEREIAIPSLGESQIFLSYKELNNILKANSPITILSGK